MRKNKIIYLIILVPFYCYRYLLRPLKGGASCRFYPTCSEYSIEAVKRHGFFKGLLLVFVRLVKCHPWHPGGYDPVPEIFSFGKWRE